MSIVKKSSAGRIADTMTFVLTAETPDRVGDVVMLNGLDLKSFKNNPVALVQHQSNEFPIGIWKNLRVAGDALLGDLQLAAKGTSKAADVSRALIEQGILRAVSIGFRAVEYAQLQPRGTKFIKSELLEASLVSVPMNPRALMVAKSVGMTDDELKQFFITPAGDNGGNGVDELQAQRYENVKKRAIYALINATRAQRKKGEL